MKKETGKHFYLAGALLMAFVIWTVLLGFVDVRPIGPNETSVGFGAINGSVHEMTGVHMALYTVTDQLGLIPFGFVMVFGLQGLLQWIIRKDIRQVDRNILLLGGFYLIVLTVYILFEILVINYRPVMIEGVLEVSYPSSTTVLSLCVMPASLLQLRSRLKRAAIRKFVTITIWVFTLFMVIGRLISGVHWFSDIVGGILLSAGLVLLYVAAIRIKEK